MKHGLQSVAPSAHKALRDLSVVGQPDQPLLTEAEAAARVKVFDAAKSPVRQFREWAIRWGVPVKHVGRRRLYDPEILDAFLERKTWTRRHRPMRIVG